MVVEGESLLGVGRNTSEGDLIGELIHRIVVIEIVSVLRVRSAVCALLLQPRIAQILQIDKPFRNG